MILFLSKQGFRKAPLQLRVTERVVFMRASGILMHISSLPSDYGIGTMGAAGFEFVDFLKASGQRLWQLLPVAQTSYGDSPYQSFSTFAGNPYFIDLDLLCEEKLLKKSEYDKIDWGTDETAVDYGKLYENRFIVLKKAYRRFALLDEQKHADYQKFLRQNKFWLDDYACFMAIKFQNGGISWQEWDDELRLRKPSVLKRKKLELHEEIEFWKFVQYEFFLQFGKLKAYANKNGIQIIGDIPIYVALDSADVWSNPGLFLLDDDLRPIDVAGCPPDYFSKTGQLWGNPLYRWDVMEKDNYAWWIKRIMGAGKTYDIVRIDHFRGFESYYSIPATAKTAKKGEWRKGPDMALFDELQKQKKRVPNIIAEDLGLITPPVRALLKASGYPGMKVLQFAFNARQDNLYLPHNYDKNCICYLGTHDNNTTEGWLADIADNSKADLKYLMDYLHVKKITDCRAGLTRLAMSSIADTVILTMQDLLGLPEDARMNMPSIPQGYWRWRMTKEQYLDKTQRDLLFLTKLYQRA